MIADGLRRVLLEYGAARGEPFTGHPLANFIRSTLPKGLIEALQAQQPNLTVTGSPGQGQWADVPWLAVFDASETDTAQRGIYAVYLFNVPAGTVALSLNQGTTAVRREFGATAPEALLGRSKEARLKLRDWMPRFPIGAIDLGSSRQLPKDYEAGHILGVTYSLSQWPDEKSILSDLTDMVRAYRALLFRGPPVDLVEEAPKEQGGEVLEMRQYGRHLRIERNPTAAKKAKRLHGTTCRACGLDFAKRYGALGEGFIEAHHLRPLHALEEGKPTALDIEKDFTVLCSNCHRMIHRMVDPSDLKGLRKILRAQRELIKAAKAGP